MEFPLVSVALALLLAATTGLMVAVMNWVWFTPKRLEKCLRQQGFAGNPYRILYGDSKERVAIEKNSKLAPISISDDILPRVAPFQHHIVQTYGKKSFMWSGPAPFVIITEPEIIKDIFAKFNDISKQRSNPLTNLLASGVATYLGEKWAKHRRIINPAFHMEKLKLMVPAFEESCSKMIGKWDQLAVSAEGRFEVDVWPYLQELTSDSISRTAFGSNYMEGKKIFDLLEEQSGLTAKVLQSFYIPGWRFLPTKANNRMKHIDQEIRASLRKIINKREKLIEAGEERIDDLLGLLMLSNQAEKHANGDEKGRGMSVNDVIEECKLFYVAGQLTLASTLVWTLVLLAKYEDWQARAREEVFQVFHGNMPDFDNLNRLKIISMILNEVLRLYPPIVHLLRTVSKEVKIGDVVLPVGVNATILSPLVQRDPELWGPDALEFNPQRFAEGISKATPMQGALIPFGGGPRICMGQNYALVEAKIVLSMILHRYSFKLSPSYAHAPCCIITLQPQHGAHIILEKL